MITPEKRTIADILDTGNVTYHVPPYQREFRWGEDQAIEMLQDLNTSDQVFLGTFIFMKQNEEKRLDIVDGQQRMTAIYILLSALRMRAQELDNTEQANEIQRMLTFKDRVTGKQADTKLYVSPSIRDAFSATVLKSDWNGSFDLTELRGKKRQATRIKSLFKIFREATKNSSQEAIDHLLRTLYDSTVVALQIESEEDVFDIFERANARGVDLNAAELLKNYFYQKHMNQDDVDARWQEIIERGGTVILRMLRYFYIMRNGLIQRKQLFARLRDYGNKVGPQALLDELDDFSYIYAAVTDPRPEALNELIDTKQCNGLRDQWRCDELRLALEGLSLFGISQPYPLVIALFNSYVCETDREKKAANTLNRTLSNLERYHFANNAVGGLPGNSVEKDFARLAEQISNEYSFDEAAHALNTYLRRSMLPREQFIAKFIDLSYGSDDNLLYYAFDRINNRDKPGASRVQIFHPDKRLRRRSFNLEHLAPQHLVRHGEMDEDICNSVGNLVAVPVQVNSKLGNRPLAEKIEILKTDLPHLPTVQAVCEMLGEASAMTPDLIKQRAHRLANEAYEWSTIR